MSITVDMVEAIQVQFLKPIFEEDFPEKGMKAWLTGVEWDSKSDCYKLYFDFKDFEEHNDKYFREVYHMNLHTQKLGLNKQKYTAKEAGYYTQKYSVYFSCGDHESHNDKAFKEEIIKYLRIVEEI